MLSAQALYVHVHLKHCACVASVRAVCAGQLGGDQADLQDEARGEPRAATRDQEGMPSLS